MNYFRIAILAGTLLALTGCLSHEVVERNDFSRDQYEAYLKRAVYSGMNQEGEDPFETRLRHIEFFTTVTGDREIATIIYDEAGKYNVEAELAFALVFNESSFNPRAVNKNSNSIDRGLFQLNSKSFPQLKTEEFFDPTVNVPHGIAYLRYCLDIGGNEVAALAMYNAGPNRVRDNRTPNMTLNYIAKIQKYKSELLEGSVPEEFDPDHLPIPDMKSVKNITLLMEQRGEIN